MYKGYENDEEMTRRRAASAELRLGSAARWPQRVVRSALTAALFAASVGTTASAQDPVVFRSTVELVRLQAMVFASDGGPVMDLSRNDFTVTEEGEERPISVFIAPDSGPSEIVFAIDSSGSMERWQTREAAHALLDELNPRTCVLLLPFKEVPGQGIWGHPDDPNLRQVVAELEFDRDEAIYDTLLAAFRVLDERERDRAPSERSSPEGSYPDLDALRWLRRPGRWLDTRIPPPDGSCTATSKSGDALRESGSVRRAVVVLTDGHDYASNATLDDVLLEAWGGGIPVFALAIIPRPRPGMGLPAAHASPNMTALAEHTGGLVIRGGWYSVVSDDPHFVDDVRKLGLALRGHYTLGYVPAESGPDRPLVERRSIEVSVRRTGVDVVTARDLVLGRGRSRGAAFRFSLDGFWELARGRAEEALGHFATAVTLAPELGLAHYGRGITLARLERAEEASLALEQASRLAPWIPDLDAQLADSYLSSGRVDLAWDHAIRAYDNGSLVLSLIARLRQLDPRPFDPDRVPTTPRVQMRSGASPGLMGALESPAILAALAAAIDDSDEISFATGGRRVFTLTIDITKAQHRSQRLDLEGWLTLDHPNGEKIAERKFKMRDAEAAAALTAKVQEFLDFIEEALRERRNDYRQ